MEKEEISKDCIEKLRERIADFSEMLEVGEVFSRGKGRRKNKGRKTVRKGKKRGRK